MPLYKLRIEAPDLTAGQAASAAVEGLEAPAPLALTLFELTPPRFALEAYFDAPPSLSDIGQRLAQGGMDWAVPALEEVPEQNWVALSQASLPPIAAGRLVVHGSHDRARFTMRRFAVEIEAGEAFGTGYNATTALCLEALDALAKRRPFAGVLDLGCGSGVLAIAAARVAPSTRVLATDNDPVAVAIARENARLNRVDARVQVLEAAGLAHPALRRGAPFDLVLANILPGPLIALAPALRRAIGRGGVAVLSGLLNHQQREVAAAWRAHGFRLVRRLQRAGWTALVLVKPSPWRRRSVDMGPDTSPPAHP